MGLVVTWSTSTLVGWLLSVSVVADGRQRLFPRGRSQLPPSSSRRPSKGRAGEHAIQFNHTPGRPYDY